MNNVNILSGGAAQGLVASLATDFKARTGLDISGEFGAVGAMADKLRSGMPTDLIILTAALVAGLAEEGLVVPSSMTDVGTVETALAVRSRDPRLSVRNADELRAAAISSRNDSIANTLPCAPSVRSAEVRTGMVSRRWLWMVQAGKS